jgi:hypothetical protein
VVPKPATPATLVETVASLIVTSRPLRTLVDWMIEDRTLTDVPKTGTIILPGAKKIIDCIIIIELSDTGAHLKVPALLGIPPHFAFAAGEKSPRKASVVWWDVDAVGIHFDDK